MVILKSEDEIAVLRQAGLKLSKILRDLKSHVKEGITTKHLDELAEKMIFDSGCTPAFKGYLGFPATICTSINEEVVHGIPSEKRILKASDILSMDLGLKYQGFFADAALTMAVGKIDIKLKKLIEITQKSLYLGIAKAYPGKRLSDVSCAVQNFAEDNGFSVVRQFCGHGIGRDIHEDPEIPNYGKPGTGIFLREGMVLAIEPMINMGTWEVEIASDGWTALTKDRLASAHFEHTIAITRKGPLILTE